MKKRVLLALTALMVLTAIFSGCETTKPDKTSEQSAAPGGAADADGVISEADVPYAGPMAENILAAIENRDYEAFSKDLGDTMKAAMTKEAFNSLVDFLAKVGSFEKLSFGEGANVTQDGVAMTVIVYIAKYSEEPGDVLVTITFTRDDERKIIGLYFNSPKLREQ